MSQDRITLFHGAPSRSTGVLTLLEELGASYDLQVLDLKAGDQRKPEFLAVNPMGKVPVIRHGDAVVTEQGAVYIYLADLFPAAGLAPAPTDPLRGPYLRWLVFYGSSFEPALIDRATGREPPPLAMSPYGTFDTVFSTIAGQVAKGPYLLGERFTAADVLWGTALAWTRAFKLLPESAEIDAYVARVTARPAFAKVRAIDQELAARSAA